VDHLAHAETERAIEMAYGALGRRERTVAELRSYLERKRVEPTVIDAAVMELRDAGLLDDRSYARRFADDKRQLEQWGSERIARELRRRGVAPQLIADAVETQEAEAELGAALVLLERRFPHIPRDDRERDRAWRLLVRRGYPSDLAYEAVRTHERRLGERRQAS
jgi:regulatory protein